MDNSFDLPVIYKEQSLNLPTTLIVSGYTHKFEVMINERAIFFEPDEERNYRAIVDATTFHQIKVEIGLLEAIASALALLGE